MSYRLHCFAQSGNAYKAALMLELAGAEWEPVFVDFFNGATRTPEYRAINEMGEAPVLEHGETRLSQSGVILDYLAGSLGFLPPQSAAERRSDSSARTLPARSESICAWRRPPPITRRLRASRYSRTSGIQ